MFVQVGISLHKRNELGLICDGDVRPSNGANNSENSRPTAQLQHTPPFGPSNKVDPTRKVGRLPSIDGILEVMCCARQMAHSQMTPPGP